MGPEPCTGKNIVSWWGKKECSIRQVGILFSTTSWQLDLYINDCCTIGSGTGVCYLEP
jgi:hypothetical protein